MNHDDIEDDIEYEHLPFSLHTVVQVHYKYIGQYEPRRINPADIVDIDDGDINLNTE